MNVVMRLIGDAYGNHDAWSGMYLRDFNFEAGDGIGEIDMTGDIDKAKRFGSIQEAVIYRSTQPKCKPLRDDGLPNRPLTATTWQFASVEENINE